MNNEGTESNKYLIGKRVKSQMCELPAKKIDNADQYFQAISVITFNCRQ
jgi:hypothetical protein